MCDIDEYQRKVIFFLVCIEIIIISGSPFVNLNNKVVPTKSLKFEYTIRISSTRTNIDKSDFEPKSIHPIVEMLLSCNYLTDVMLND